MGNLGFEEGILGWVADARKRFLKDNGRIIPKEVELIMAPVKYNPERDRSAAWKKDLYRLDFSSGKEIADNQIFPIRLDHRDVLGKPESFVKADLNKELPAQFEAMRQFKIDKKGVLQGLAGWFHARLTEEIVLTNAPPSNIPSWWQVFFPLVEMIEVEPGEHVSLQISLDRDGGAWSWKVKHGLLASLQGNEAQWDFEHRTSGGEILPKRDEHDFQIKPTLDPDAYLDLHILQAMDGEHSLEDIALDVMERFPGTFRNIETAREHMYSFYEDYGRSP
jgi:protein arginine N-methyltransferase 1